MKKLLSLIIVISISTSSYSQTISLNGEFAINTISEMQNSGFKVKESGKYHLGANFDFTSNKSSMVIYINNERASTQFYGISGKNVSDGGKTVNIDLINEDAQPMKFKISLMSRGRYIAMFPWMPSKSVGLMLIVLTEDDKRILGIN